MAITIIPAENLFKEIVNHIKPAQVVLDIGCGIRPQNFIIPIVHICCEPHKEYLDYLKTKRTFQDNRTFVFLHSTWEALRSFPDKSVDTIFLLDVIEHLEKDEAFHLIKHMERISTSQIIIFTPLGFIPQNHPDGKDAWGMNGGKWQEHISGWFPEDFGEKWNFFVSENFYTLDNKGKELNPPRGAFFAIKEL